MASASASRRRNHQNHHTNDTLRADQLPERKPLVKQLGYVAEAANRPVQHLATAESVKCALAHARFVCCVTG